MAKDKGFAAKGKLVGGIRLDEKAVKGNRGGEPGEGLGGGVEKRAANAKPDVGAAKHRMGKQVGREGDTMKEKRGKSVGPRFEFTQECAPGACPMQNDGASEANGEGELGTERGTLGGPAIGRLAQPVKANLADKGVGIGAERTLKEGHPIGTGDGDKPRMEAKGGRDLQRAPHLDVPLLGAGGAVDAGRHPGRQRVAHETCVIGKDSGVAQVEVGVEHE